MKLSPEIAPEIGLSFARKRNPVSRSRPVSRFLDSWFLGAAFGRNPSA